MEQRALITGASSGMGLKYAEQLAGQGYDLVLVSNQEQELLQVADNLTHHYPVDVITRYQDLAVSDAADELHAWCHENGLEVEVLINNAGMFFFKELQPSDERRMEVMMNLHMMTNAKLCLLFGSDMRARGHGHILNVSSMAADLPVPGITVYSATKAFLKSFGKSLYHEMRPYGVGVTTVCPAAVATPLYRLKPSLMKLGVRIGVIWKPECLVHRALRGMFHYRRIVRPGVLNYLVPFLICILPNRVVTSIWKKLRH